MPRGSDEGDFVMTATLQFARRRASRVALAGLLGGLGASAIPVPAEADAPVVRTVSGKAAVGQTIATDHARLPGGRKLVRYTVRPGDTATELAVRFHAWTAELISYNHLGPSAAMYVGQRLRIPVVLSAVRKEREKRQAHPARHRSSQPRSHQRRSRGHAAHHRDHARNLRAHADPARAKVRRVIVRTARRHEVNPELALAISWQEAGWQMHHVSSAGAIGAMQVIPATGVWMSLYAGRPLHLRDVQDNVLAGVLLIDVLDRMTSSRVRKIAAYYQGIGAVREHGLYRDSRHYVANVLALKHRLELGWSPAG